MDKQEFLTMLRKDLREIPEEDIERSVAFYSEVIDDRMEEGLTEDEAVSSIGTVQEIAGQILSEIPVTVEEKKTRRSLGAWQIVLLILGAPVWLPLLAAAAVIALAVLVVLWSAGIAMYAVDGSMAASGITCLLAAAEKLLSGNLAEGALLVGAALISGGVAILLFLATGQAIKGIARLTRKIFRGIGRLFGRKEKGK